MPVVTPRFQHLRHGARALQNQLQLWMAVPLFIGGLLSVMILSGLNTMPAPEPSVNPAIPPPEKTRDASTTEKTDRTPTSSADHSTPTPATKQLEHDAPADNQPTMQQSQSTTSSPNTAAGSQSSTPDSTSSTNEPDNSDTNLVDEITDDLLP